MDLFSYHNTANEGYDNLRTYTRKAGSQDRYILAVFQNMTYRIHWTPFDVFKRLCKIDPKWNQVPITSIRRAISTLTKRGLLIKTDHKVKGQYGRLNYTWMLNKVEK